MPAASISITPQQFKKSRTFRQLSTRGSFISSGAEPDNKHFFRLNKANVGQMSLFEQPAFISGAVCLPKDEYENWLVTLKPIFSAPTCHLFLKWVQAHKDKIISKFGASTDDQPE